MVLIALWEPGLLRSAEHGWRNAFRAVESALESRLKAGVTGMSHFPSWLERAVLYQIHLQSFYDANGDGK